LADLEAQFDAVFVSIGTWKQSSVQVAGKELAGVFGALHFLDGEARNLAADLGDDVVVIGGGNAAIDCARTVVRKGSTATVIYRRERKDMPAIAEEVDAAEEEGVRFVFLASPHRIVGEGGAVKAIEVTKTRLGAFDTSGRRRPIDTGEIQSFPCGSVILAVGEGVDTDFCRTSELALNDRGMPEVDRYALTTSRTGVFAGGDFVTGASNVTSAMAWGKEAARNIDRILSSKPRYNSIMPIFTYGQTPPEPNTTPRHHARFLPAAVRAKTFCEAVSALSPGEARSEASRCLRCDIRETVAHAVASRQE
jgi:NADPH-dependent glutamate synthase beta subunit-like oxidoreductase